MQILKNHQLLVLSLSDSPTNKQQQQTTSSPQNQTFEQSVFSNLESHYSGELPEYQQQQIASNITSDKVVMKENPPQSTTTKTHEKTIPESGMETVVEESVQVMESETSMSITNSEPTQKLNLGASDQPSSSS